MLWDPTKDKTTKPLEPWRRVLLDAADLIDEKGHCQNALERDGKYCMGGAMERMGSRELSKSDARIAFDRLNEYCGDWFVAWNNTEGRTKEEVVAALRGVATI